jgi:flagellar biogenesis protein FliO
MGNGLWFITILKEQPWIGLVVGMVLFLLLFWVKRWVVKKLMADQETD